MGKVKYMDEIESVQAEATRLKADGIDIIIAVGHSGYIMDQRIAEEVDEVDVVVGGHTNTFLYSGKLHYYDVYFGYNSRPDKLHFITYKRRFLQ